MLNGVRREFDGDIGVAGADLAGQFVQRGLVDEYRIVVHPVVIGAGTPLGAARRADELGWSRRTFESGVMLVSYAAA